MPKKNEIYEKVRGKAREIVMEHPDGIRQKELLDKLEAQTEFTGVDRGTLQNHIWNLQEKYPKEISRPFRGIFSPIVSYKQNSSSIPPKTSNEKNFYKPFAKWFREQGEADFACELGGAYQKRKWTNPDVIGVCRGDEDDPIKYQPELISVEIKNDLQNPMEAFGQAVAYRLFSHKTYVVLPTPKPEDSQRLISLCLIFGIGLVFFDPDLKAPSFNFQVRAQRFDPDMFYVNDFLKGLKDSEPRKYRDLFINQDNED